MLEKIVNKIYSNAKGGKTTTAMGAFMVLSGLAVYLICMLTPEAKDVDVAYIGYWMLGGVVLVVTKFDKPNNILDKE